MSVIALNILGGWLPGCVARGRREYILVGLATASMLSTPLATHPGNQLGEFFASFFKTLLVFGVVGLCLFSHLAVAGEADFAGLLTQAQTELRQGQYFLTLDDLQAAQKLAETPEQKASVQGLLGQTHYQMRHYETAEGFLRAAIDANISASAELARWLVTLADLQMSRNHVEAARQFYQRAAAQAGENPELSMAIRLGQAALLPAQQRLAELSACYPLLSSIADTQLRARFYLNLGGQAQALGAAGLKLAYDSFEQARQFVGDSQARLLAESLDGLAQLYEAQQRPAEAMRLNRQGILAAQSVAAHDLLINLEWRQGRLYRQQQQNEAALAALQRAVDHIEAIRHDIPVEYHDGRSSFRDTLEPVYLALADMLLAEAGRQSGDQKTPWLRRARQTVELIKQSELEDFLGGRCAVQSNKNVLLDTLESTTAVLYPILLADRLEVLVSIGSEMRQFTLPVKASAVQEQAHALANSLRNNGKNSKRLAQQLYLWLIAPAEPWLKQHQVQTLVMVPDGVLRLIPTAALYDGEHYLVEQYALVTSPGLSLFEPSAIQHRGINALLAGMSEPGAVTEHLPSMFMQAMDSPSASRGLAVNKAQHSRALPLSEPLPGAQLDTQRTAELERLRSDPDFQRKMKEELSLPGVAVEIDNVSKHITNTVLMNQDFTVEGFNQQAVKEPYSIIHIASHGVFGSTADTSFLLAYDNIINMDQLERLLKSEKFAKQPVELLTLSACQTAEGDDRAPLGISGIALKAKVRSALGSLWPVSDEAASLLMTEFYKNLSQPGMNKVQALRQAQIKLIQQKELEHPYFWSPFILVGNWL